MMFIRRTIRVVTLLLLALSLSTIANAWVPITHHFKINGVHLHGNSQPPCSSSSSQLFQAATSPQDDDDDDTGWEDDPVTSSNESFQERSGSSSIPSGRNEPTRDLFIPIFAIVAIVGLVGSYGYEMMRLASRGELYLPWSN